MNVRIQALNNVQCLNNATANKINGEPLHTYPQNRNRIQQRTLLAFHEICMVCWLWMCSCAYCLCVCAEGQCLFLRRPWITQKQHIAHYSAPVGSMTMMVLTMTTRRPSQRQFRLPTSYRTTHRSIGYIAIGRVFYVSRQNALLLVCNKFFDVPYVQRFYCTLVSTHVHPPWVCRRECRPKQQVVDWCVCVCRTRFLRSPHFFMCCCALMQFAGNIVSSIHTLPEHGRAGTSKHNQQPSRRFCGVQYAHLDEQQHHDDESPSTYSCTLVPKHTDTQKCVKTRAQF